MSFLTRINYMRYAKQMLGFCIVTVILSLVAVGVLGLNTGIDFTGGDLLDIQFTGQVTSSQVEQAAEGILGTVPQVQQVEAIGDNADQVTEFLIRTPEMSPEVRTQFMNAMQEISSMTVVSETNVSATISRELTMNALLALGIAVLLQVIYIWFRFELKFGVTSVVALIHDVIITLGVMSLLQIQLNSTFVAATLTVLGYSMNDTIVVFDRIRENLHKRKKGEDLEELATRSIQEVITRSLYTGVSVIMVLIALLIWGGATLQDFTATLLIGTIAGTYSSVCVATTLWLFWAKADEGKKREKVARKPARA